MKFQNLGRRIAELRMAKGIAKQSDLARLVGVKQQTVSRWEAGTSRPKLDEIGNLASCLGTTAEELMRLAGYEPEIAVATFDHPFPLDALSPESFERFSLYFLSSLYPGARISRMGGTGHKQFGTDLMATFEDGIIHTFQCKRVNQFGPKDVFKAIGEHTTNADKKILLLSRIASPAARLALKNRADWELWDIEDVSRRVRALPIEDQKRLVRTFFRGQELALLGQPADSPWQTLEEFYEPFVSDNLLFNHSWQLVGRQESLRDLVDALADEGKRLVTLTGAGGTGKSRLLHEAIKEFSKANHTTSIRFLSTTGELTKQSCDDLGHSTQILVVDDAHDRENLIPLFEYTAVNSAHTKILLSMRGYGVERTLQQASRYSLSGDAVARIELPEFSKADAMTLATIALEKHGGDKSYAKNIADVTYGCPLATVVAARLVADKDIHPSLVQNENEFRHTLMGRFERIVAGHIGAKDDSETIRTTLGFIALVQPISLDDEQLADAFKAAEGVQNHDFKRIAKTLVDSGVLFKRGPKYRLSPDVLGDYLIEDRCVGSQGKSTGYAEKIYDLLPERYIQNLLLNLGRLDWRRTDSKTDESPLLDGVWTRLKPQSRYSDSTIDAVASVAYYQPRRALDFVETYIHDAEFKHQLADVAKYASYNFQHLERALACLWMLGREDARETNRYPNHPLRVLAELAEPTPGKPVEFNQKVLDFAFSLLEDPNNWRDHTSPFDILDAILRTEGHTTSSEGHMIQFSGFLISPAAVRGLRVRVVDKAIELLSSRDLKIGVRATQSVQKALRFPMGLMGIHVEDKLRDEWQAEFESTLRKLLSAVRFEKIDSSVQVELAKAVSWHAQHGVGQIAKLAKELLSSLSDSLEFRVSKVLSDGFGMEDRRGNWSDHDTRWRKHLESLASEVQTTFDTGTSQLEFIEERLQKLRDGKKSDGASPQVFLNVLIEHSPDFAEALVLKALDATDANVDRFAGMALGHIFKCDSDKGRSYMGRYKASNQNGLQQAIGIAYTMQEFRDDWFTDFDRNMILSILSSSHPPVVHAAIRSLRRIVEWNKSETLAFVLATNIVDTQIADELATLFEFGNAIPYRDLSETDVSHFLSKLENLQELDGHWIEKFLAAISEFFPLITAKFLMKRVEIAETAGSGYRSSNHGPWQHEAMRFRKTPEGGLLMKTVAEWMKNGKSRGWSFNYHARCLFNVMFAPIDAEFIGFLEDWLSVSQEQDVLAIADILRESEKPGFVFDYKQFTIALLERANQFGRDKLKAVSSELYCVTRTGLKSGTAGQPFPEDIACRDRAIEVLKSLPRYSVAYELYDGLRKDAERDIKSKQDDEW